MQTYDIHLTDIEGARFLFDPHNNISKEDLRDGAEMPADEQLTFTVGDQFKPMATVLDLIAQSGGWDTDAFSSFLDIRGGGLAVPSCRSQYRLNQIFHYVISHPGETPTITELDNYYDELFDQQNVGVESFLKAEGRTGLESITLNVVPLLQRDHDESKGYSFRFTPYLIGESGGITVGFSQEGAMNFLNGNLGYDCLLSAGHYRLGQMIDGDLRQRLGVTDEVEARIKERGNSLLVYLPRIAIPQTEERYSPEDVFGAAYIYEWDCKNQILKLIASSCSAYHNDKVFPESINPYTNEVLGEREQKSSLLVLPGTNKFLEVPIEMTEAELFKGFVFPKIDSTGQARLIDLTVGDLPGSFIGER